MYVLSNYLDFSKDTPNLILDSISVMSDYGLPDFGGQDLGIDLDKNIFVRKNMNGKLMAKGDNDSNDSGNNSMNTNGSGTTYMSFIAFAERGTLINLTF